MPLGLRNRALFAADRDAFIGAEPSAKLGDIVKNFSPVPRVWRPYSALSLVAQTALAFPALARSFLLGDISVEEGRRRFLLAHLAPSACCRDMRQGVDDGGKYARDLRGP